MKIDHALITALVERWRSETHTFHFPTGEATVTLQDVQVLWGLSIEGSPVVASDLNHSVEEWVQLCQMWMGFTPPQGAISNNRIRLSCLNDVLNNPLPIDAPERECERRAIVYILYLLGGYLLADLSGSSVYLHHLTFFMGGIMMGRLMSWESAILAFLYRRLCKATSYTATEICGPLVLLQLWVWERLPTLCPIRRSLDIDFTRPYGSRWVVNFNLSRSPMHVLRAYRDQLTSLRPDQFVWLPYSEDVLASLLSYCIDGQASWQSVTYLLCWEVVEPHLPNRVMRQFGMHQPIPVPRLLENHAYLHRLIRSGRFESNWRQVHGFYHDHWMQRLAYVENGNVVDDLMNMSLEYMTWYRPRNVIYITKPNGTVQFQGGFQENSSTAEFLMDGMCRMFYLSLDGMAASDYMHRGYFAQMRDLSSQYMSLVRGQQRMQTQLPHVVQEVHGNNDPEIIQREERRVPKERQGGRRRRPRVSEVQTQIHASNIGESSSYDPHLFDFITPTSEMHTPPPGSFVHSFNIVDTVEGTNEQDVPVDDNVPIAQRRQRRVIKHPRCGTH